MEEGGNDFQLRIIPIENGYVIKGLGRVLYFDNAKSLRGKVDRLIVEWQSELGPFHGD